MKKYYEILGLEEGASKEKIEKKYKQLCEELDPEINDIPEKNKIDFCNCKVDKAFESNIEFKELMSIQDINKVAYNKIIFPCSMLLDEIQNSYNEKDIIGLKHVSEISLLTNGSLMKVEISIGDLKRYYLFDTGAADLVINSELEKELKEMNLINFNSYLGEKEFEIADGSIIKAKRILLNNVIIGDYKINNVIAYVVEEGGMLCGVGFMNKFKDWNLDVKDKTLIIHK